MDGISEDRIRQAARETLRHQRSTSADVEDIADMIARVDAMGDVGYLVEPLWPADAYGVIAAMDKAGKTWAALDMAVSICIGGSWLGRFPCQQGRALVYCGEGGARNIVRRVRAIAEHKGTPEGLLGGQLHVSERAPRLRDAQALDSIREELVVRKTALVVIDPLYLAAAGGKGSDLYAMGELLSGVQEACQDQGAALVLTHHWNKGGEGAGAQRMTGVGPGAWGRVLGSGDVVRVEKDGDRETVTVEWAFTGSEIPSQDFTMVRTVWSDDVKDLSCPLHYEVECLEGRAKDLFEIEELDRVEAWLRDNPGQSIRSAERALRTGRVRDYLHILREQGRADYVAGPRRAQLWSSRV